MAMSEAKGAEGLDRHDMVPARSEQGGGMMEVASSRAAQEVQAALVIAKRFPRDFEKVKAKVLRACSRPGLARESGYLYPRGGELVSGPSIRLAEVLAQNWGNLDFGIVEVEQVAGKSVMQTYAWDLESNARQTKVFTISHQRHTRSGSYTLTDSRDIYELTANQGARRLRACILGIIPGDLQDEAQDECDKAMLVGHTLEEWRVSLVKWFGDAFGITLEQLEHRVKTESTKWKEHETVMLMKIYRTLKDNQASVGDYFGKMSGRPPERTGTRAQQVASRLSGAGKPAATTEQPKSPEPAPAPTENEFSELLDKTSVKPVPAAPAVPQPAAPAPESKPDDHPPVAVDHGEAVSEVTMRCPKCGFDNAILVVFEDGAAQCQNCEAVLDSIPEEAPPAPPAEATKPAAAVAPPAAEKKREPAQPDPKLPKCAKCGGGCTSVGCTTGYRRCLNCGAFLGDDE